ncbi:conserved hypothetical protein [Haliangium ochraceum DSM 14365]|uniref:Uncharacterized protein n=2 Tax=Haliangium ochraceum TaxID=80816 RepID=D0LHX9_HALO1|nr:conserved hypothetical protein [Haliangium ochraceum DSM 14365]
MLTGCSEIKPHDGDAHAHAGARAAAAESQPRAHHAATEAVRMRGGAAYDPLAEARRSQGQISNREAVIPPQCYTKTGGVSNPCWTCHTASRFPNDMSDLSLQEAYAFSDFALTNRWSNLFVDLSADIAAISDQEILGYVRQDNYAPLRAALAQRDDYAGYAPDLDFSLGFDEHGFARDGSDWRAFRYKPFPGTFWPTNGSTDDVLIRLPARFRQTAAGVPSREIYRANLSLLEASMASDPRIRNADLRWPSEPLDERSVGIDLDGDGALQSGITELVGLPTHFVGGAAKVPLERGLYPQGTEFLHSVRYLDPDHPSMTAARMKELRYARKVRFLDTWAILYAYAEEREHKDRGFLPQFAGSPEVGLQNSFGWQLQGFIEDAEGRLRLQTHEEHYSCMGCHSTTGVTADQTFAFPRKQPGAAGWGYQSLVGMADVPQVGHRDPEVLTYFQRVAGGDEFRANDEVLERFFPGGVLDEDQVRRAAPGGDRDLTHLLLPSRERALLLDKAYRARVRRQNFHLGRDGGPMPPENVHRSVENGATELAAARRVFTDGRLQLDWNAATAGPLTATRPGPVTSAPPSPPPAPTPGEE